MSLSGRNGSSPARHATAAFSKTTGIVLLLANCLWQPSHAAEATATAASELASSELSPQPKRVDFGHEQVSKDTHDIADWVIDSGDNHTLPFIIVDKAQAKTYVFDGKGTLRGAASALLGLAIGDDSVPGIGKRKLATIRPDERTTPAGRFVASLDRNLHGAEILWIDYDAAISMHRVITSNRKERRAERLASSDLLDKRISYGCINVPVKFYNEVVSPAFRRTNGIVYVLPETRSARKTFGAYDVEEHTRLQLTKTPSPAAKTMQPDSGVVVR